MWIGPPIDGPDFPTPVGTGAIGAENEHTGSVGRTTGLNAFEPWAELDGHLVVPSQIKAAACDGSLGS